MKKIRVLSIDGGGVKGLVPAIICKYLEDEISKRINKKIFLHEYFDFIVGTSTGGILGALYTSPKLYSSDEILTLYKELGKKIFKKTLVRKITSFGGLFRPKYSTEPLEKISETLFGDTNLSDTLKPFMAMSYDLIKSKEIFFDSLNAKRKSFKNFKLKDVVIATSSAPVYFNAKKIISDNNNVYNCIDGGLFANNPGLLAYVEARNINFKKYLSEDKPSYPNAENILLISLGTGKKIGERNYAHLKAKGGAKWLLPIINILFSSQSNVNDFILKKIFDSSENKWNYFRLNPCLYKSSLELDDVTDSNIKNLSTDTEEFISKNLDKLDDIIYQLISNH